MEEIWCNRLINTFPDFESIEEKCKKGATVSDFYDRWKLSAYLTFLKIVADGSKGEKFDAVVFVEGLNSACRIQKALEYLMADHTEYLSIQSRLDHPLSKFRHRDTDKIISVALPRYENLGLTTKTGDGFTLLLDPPDSIRREPADIGLSFYTLEIGKDPNACVPDPFDTKTAVKLSKFSGIFTDWEPFDVGDGGPDVEWSG